MCLAVLGVLVVIVYSVLSARAPSTDNDAVVLLAYLFGVCISTFGSTLKQRLFCRYEIDTTHFHFIDQVVKFLFLGAVTYPLVSLVECDGFGVVFLGFCTDNRIDHPVLTPHYLHQLSSAPESLILMVVSLLALVVLYNFSSFTKTSMTKEVSVRRKFYILVFSNVLVFVADLILYDFVIIVGQKTTLMVWLVKVLVNTVALSLFFLACILVREVYRVPVFNLHRHFGRYSFNLRFFGSLKNEDSINNSVLSSKSSDVPKNKFLNL